MKKKSKLLRVIPLLLFTPIAITGLVSCGEVTDYIPGLQEGYSSLTTNNDTVKGGHVDVSAISKDGEIVTDFTKLEDGDVVTLKAVAESGYEFEKFEILTKTIGAEGNGSLITYEETQRLPISEVALEIKVNAYFKSTTVVEEKATIIIDSEIKNGKIILNEGELNSNQKVALGTKISVDAIPDKDYELETLKVNGTSILNTKEFDATESIDYIVSATFKLKEVKPDPTIKTATIVYDEDLVGGNVSFEKYNNNSKVELNTEVTVNVEVFSGYELETLTVNNTDIKGTRRFKVTEENKIYHVKATFKQIQEETKSIVKIDENIQGGTVSFEGIESGAKVGVGATIKVNVTPNQGYILETLTVNDESILSTNTFKVTEPNITYLVKATFKKLSEAKPSTISYENNIANGSISFEGHTNNEQVTLGTKVTVLVNANDGYELDTLTVNGKDIKNTKTFDVVEENITYLVKATFKESSTPVEEKFTIAFDKCSGNGSTRVDNSDFKNKFTSSSTKVDHIEGSNVFEGTKALRMASSNAATLTIYFSENITLNEVTLNTKHYNNDTGTAVLKAGTKELELSNILDGKFTVDFNGVSTSKLVISVPSKKRFYLESIELNGANGGGNTPIEPPVVETGTVKLETVGTGTAYADKYDGKVGDSITVTTEPGANMYVSSVTVNGISIYSSDSIRYRFDLQKGENKVVVTFDDLANKPEVQPNDNLFADPSVKAMASRGSHADDVEEYYASVTTQTGAALKRELDRICQPTKRYSYDHLRESYPETDFDPDHPDKLYLFYTGELYSIRDFGGNWTYINREHVWPNSRGAGKSGPGSDKHMLRPCEKNINSSRGSLDFGYVTNGKDLGYKNPINAGNKVGGGFFEPKDEFKGDVARIIFYLATVYDSMELARPSNTNQFNYWTSTHSHGKFEDLYKWATDPSIDPVSRQEMSRNNMIDQKYQHNRNPFIDHPEWIERIYNKGFKL